MNGIVNLFKPAGMTSFSAAAAVRRISGERKCGHGGTLDPEATGVLPVLLGKATRLSDVFLTLPKTYEARLRFGRSYDTGDVWGNVIAELTPEQERRLAALTDEEISAAATMFTGPIAQVPPAYSALKIGGVPAYKLARKGEVPELKARIVNVYSIETGELTEGPEGREVTLRVKCGRGTYIRTLCCDIAAQLGFPGSMASLVRTSYGPLTLENALTPDQFTAAASAVSAASAAEGNTTDLPGFILPCETILGGFDRIELTGQEADDYRFGRPILVDRPDSELLRVYAEGRLLGLGTVTGGNLKSRINLS